MPKKTKIILLIVLISVIILGGAVWYFNRDSERILQNTENSKDIKTERLKDPNLLYTSTYWAGLCRNSKGERGGCYTERYLYSNGEYVEENGWIGLNNKTKIQPVDKWLEGTTVREVRKQIEESGLMAKDCLSQEIMDAGWDYQINLDGVKKSFHNPPEECKNIFDNIDQIIDSAKQNI